MTTAEIKTKLDALTPTSKGWLHRACHCLADIGEYIPDETAMAECAAAGLIVVSKRKNGWMSVQETAYRLVYTDGYLGKFELV